MAKAAAAARVTAAAARPKSKSQRKGEAVLDSSADEDAPPEPKKAKIPNHKASDIAKQAAAEVEPLQKMMRTIPMVQRRQMLPQ